MWNIERGIRLEAVIKELGSQNADVLLLQEVDIGCKRSYFADVSAEIAQALGMISIYVNEMDDVNEESLGGSEGNAILTRLNVLETNVITIPCVRVPYQPKHDHLKIHSCPVALISTHLGPITFVSVHLDAFAGRVARLDQFQVIHRALGNNKNPIVLGGDLNTHSHGLARFSKIYVGDDPYRFKMWGMSEAEWWQKTYFDMLSKDNSSPQKSETILSILQDPYHKTKDITSQFSFLWSAKLDWLLVSQEIQCLNHTLSNTTGNGASDHAYLVSDITLK